MVLVMTDYTDLIARLEKATVPDRKLDVLIKLVITNAAKPYSDLLDTIGVPGIGWKPSEDEWPPFTSSIDAALTLVTPGCDWLLNVRGNYACIWDDKESGRHGRWEAQARSIPIAICIAALKARSAK